MDLINYDDNCLINTNNQLSDDSFNLFNLSDDSLYLSFDFSQIPTAKEQSLVNDFDHMNMNNNNQNFPTMNTLNTMGNDDEPEHGGLSHEDASFPPVQINLPPTASQCRRL